MEIAYLNSQSKIQIIDWDRFSSALIIEIERGGKNYTSTAVAIGRNMLLTAAHSVDQYTNGKVILGDNYHTSEDHIGIKRCIIHPEYNPGKSFFENDLAIIILEHNLPDKVNIERLSESVFISNGDVLDRVGFGMRNKKNIRTWSNPVFISETFNKKNLVLEDSMSVIGDSGGPIFKNDNGVMKLIGIHSTLEGSNKTYIVNVQKYLDWIDSNKELKSLN